MNSCCNKIIQRYPHTIKRCEAGKFLVPPFFAAGTGCRRSRNCERNYLDDKLRLAIFPFGQAGQPLTTVIHFPCNVRLASQTPYEID
eukprot:jgi/Mesvir1/8080/Mv25267-RA.1